MKVTQYCRFLFVFILFLSKGYFSYSQKVEPDSVNIFKEEIEYRNFNPDSANPDFIPLDFRFLPADLLYSHKWDTLNASGSKFVFNKSDTVIIFLHCEPGHPCFVFPFKGKTISDFGYRGRRPHTGVDIKLNLGDTILCAFDGVVRMSRYYHGYGNMVIVRHKNGIETLYGHMSKRIVKVNQVVRAGDVLGLGGRTGHATGPHLHF